MSNNLYRKGVSIALNMHPAVDEMSKHFLRLIEQVTPLFWVASQHMVRRSKKLGTLNNWLTPKVRPSGSFTSQ